MYRIRGVVLLWAGGGPGAPKSLAPTIVKVGLGPQLLQTKSAQNHFGSLGPPTFKSVTTPLLANLCLPSGPGGQIGRHWLAGGPKGSLITDVFLDRF